jgi:hypothetical protein
MKTPADIPNWPAFIEPYTGGTLIATPDGKVLVPRTMTAFDPTKVYDVVNRRGELEREIELSTEMNSIAGFGKGCVYMWAARSERYGYLERHPWP